MKSCHSGGNLLELSFGRACKYRPVVVMLARPRQARCVCGEAVQPHLDELFVTGGSSLPRYRDRLERR